MDPTLRRNLLLLGRQFTSGYKNCGTFEVLKPSKDKPKTRFQMSSWISYSLPPKLVEGEECGTSCCLAGLWLLMTNREEEGHCFGFPIGIAPIRPSSFGYNGSWDNFLYSGRHPSVGLQAMMRLRFFLEKSTIDCIYWSNIYFIQDVYSLYYRETMESMKTWFKKQPLKLKTIN